MIQNANEAMIDAFIRHQIYLLKHAGWWENQILKFMERSEATFLKKLLSDPSKTTTQRKLGVYKALSQMRGDAWKKAIEFSEKTSDALVKYEMGYNEDVIIHSAPVQVDFKRPHLKQLQGFVRRKAFGGKPMKKWLKKLQKDDIKRLKNVVNLGMLEGKSNQEIAKDAKGLFNLTKQQTTAVVRTATNSISNNVREKVIEENSDIIDEVEFVATLDSRTTIICMALDGKRYPVGKALQPPMHYQCRSCLSPVLLPEPLVQRPAKPFVRKDILDRFTKAKGIPEVKSLDDLPSRYHAEFKGFEKKTIRELTTRLPGKTTYQEFLGRQSKAFQDEVLGEQRAELFRKGGLPLEKFIDKKGNVLSIGQLRKREAAAFKKAGLD